MWLAALLCLAHGMGAGLVVVDADAEAEPLAPHITTWVDATGAASLAEARAHLDAGEDVVVGAPNLGLRRAVFWVRLPLRAVSDDRWLVRAGFPRPQHAEVWSLAGDVVVDHAVSGIEVAPGARTIPSTEVLLPVASTADVAYLRFDSRPARLALDIASAQVRAREHVTAGRFSGLYYGIVVGLFLFNLAFGLATRDAGHFLYCLFVAAMTMHVSVRDGWLIETGPRFVLEHGAGLTVTALVMLAFTRRFLSIDAHLPRAKRVYDVVVAACALTSGAAVVVDVSRLAGWLNLVAVVVVLGSAGARVRAGDRPALLFLLAWAPMIGVTIVALGNALGVIDAPWASEPGVRISSAFEMILLALALAARVSALREGKEQAERALHEATVQRQQEVLRHVLRTQEDERARFSRELHDGVGHSLLLLKQTAQASAPDLSPALAACIDDVRRLSRALAPALLERLGLISALRALCDTHQKATGVVVTLRTTLDDAAVAALPAARSIHAFRVVQEALANATRHGAPQRIDVDVALALDGDGEDGRFVVRVDDDGGGVDGDVRFGNGLHGMEQRAQLLGGTLRFSSSERGCVVEMQVPWPPAAGLTQPTPAPDNAA